jgi:hypothetical protein
VLVWLLDTARAKCQTFSDFERFSKAFPGQSSGLIHLYSRKSR